MKKVNSQISPSKKHQQTTSFSVEEYALQYGVSLEEIQ